MRLSVLSGVSVGRSVLVQDETCYEKAVVVLWCGRLKPLCEESFAVHILRKCREVVSTIYKYKLHIIWVCINSFKRCAYLRSADTVWRQNPIVPALAHSIPLLFIRS